MPQAVPSSADPSARDRTSLIVRVAMVVLLLLGITTVFGETLAGALFPASDAAESGAAAKNPVERR